MALFGLTSTQHIIDCIFPGLSFESPIINLPIFDHLIPEYLAPALYNIYILHI